MNPGTIIAQIIITVVVVGLYHLLVSGKKQPAPPAPAAQPAPAPAPKQATPAPAAVPAAPSVQPAVAVQSAAGNVEPEMVAVIAAAIAVVIGPHRVVSVQQTAPAPEVNVWALEGRVEHFMSHRVR